MLSVIFLLLLSNVVLSTVTKSACLHFLSPVSAVAEIVINGITRITGGKLILTSATYMLGPNDNSWVLELQFSHEKLIFDAILDI